MKLLNDKQQEAVTHLSGEGGGMLWWKVGKGKTRIALFWFLAMQKKLHLLGSTYFVVVCRRRSFLDWRNEIKLVMPDMQVFEDHAPVHPPGSKHAILLVSEGKLATMQGDGFFSSLPIRLVVLDEGWLYANHQSLKSKAAHIITKSHYALVLSGTMMKAKNVLELYSQAMAVNKHKWIAPNPTAFRREFQICQNYGGFPSYSTKPGAMQKFLQRCKSISHIHFPSDEREIINQFHDIEPTPQQLQLFDELRKFYSATGSTFELELNNALAVIAKAQQISDGWIKDQHGDYHIVDSNKPEKLRDELQSIIASGQRCVVWCAFRYSVKMLADYLPFATVQMLGGQDFDVAAWNDPSNLVCLATEASGSAVNYFAQTPYAIYYSGNFKWKDMQQSRGRTARENSSHTSCHYKYLQVLQSFDSHVYQTALDSGAAEASLISLHKTLTTWLQPKRNITAH